MEMASGDTVTSAQCTDIQRQNARYMDLAMATNIVNLTNNKPMGWTWEEDSQIKKQGRTKAHWRHQWAEYGW